MKTRTITQRAATRSAAMLINTGLVVIMFFAFSLNASAQLFRTSGDTTIFSHGAMWGSSLSSFWGYTALNTDAFNQAMEKQGAAPLTNWMLSVGLGRSYAINNQFHVGVYGYWGVTPGSGSSSSQLSSSLNTFGLDEYLGYIVLQNETFRLIPQLGLHLNWRNYTARERGGTVDVSSLGLNNFGIEPRSIQLSSLDMSVSLGIAGDVRIPFPRLYRLEGSQETYREDLIIGFQAAYAFDLLSRGNTWLYKGARVNNLPSIGAQGLSARITFTTDLHLLK